jgi:hypothetical protein
VLCDVWTADASAKVNLVIHPTAAPMLTPSNSSAAAAALSSVSHSPPQQGVAGTKSNSESGNMDNPSPAATRNLIGSLVASAAKLFNTDDELGIYFVFQDLSIRTEGTFRLGFSLMDVGSYSIVSNLVFLFDLPTHAPHPIVVHIYKESTNLRQRCWHKHLANHLLSFRRRNFLE